MPTDLTLPQHADRNATEWGVRAEALGYDGLWLGELWGVNPVARLAELAVRTDEVALGTAVLNVFSRTPALLAMTAATLDRIADGRFRLGLGTSTRTVVEGLHGVEWDDPNPVRRAHETIELVRAFLAADDRVDYEGSVFSVEGIPSLDRDVPIYHAALGEANRRVVARLCDGWMPHNVPFPALEENYAYIRDRAEAAGRTTDIDVAPWVPAAVSDDPAEAADVIRGHVAYYVGNGRGYENAVAGRFPGEAAAVAEAWRDGDREAAAGAVTDEMVAALGVAGTAEQAREQLAAVAGIDCVTRPVLKPPENAPDRVVERTIEALAPANR